MDNYIQKLSAYISKHPPTFGNEDISSILDIIYQNYSEYNNLDNSIIERHFRDLYNCLDHLNLRDTDKVIDITCALCSEYERIYFTAGIRIGVRLVQEII